MTQWRGQPDTSNRRLGWLVLASLLVHAPFTPLVALLGLFGWLATKKPDLIDGPAITAIPVDLFEGEDAPAPPAPPPPEPVAATESAPTPKKPHKPPPEPVDAGVADAAPDAEVADAGAPPDAGAGDAGTKDGAGHAPNPMANLVGDAKKVVDQDANVRLVVYPEKIRNHPLGPRIGRMLGSIYQWRDFFGPTGLDPIRDVDRIMVVGPELRDSSKVAAILKLNVGAARLHDAVDAIVKADAAHGEWLDAGIPAATAYADRAPRIFALPSPNVVVVVPPTAKDAALGLRKVNIPKPQGGEVMWAYAVNPWRPARMLRLDLPKSIKWAKIWVTPAQGGGALVEAEGEDESADAAETDAAQLMAVINQNLALADTIGSILGGVLGVQAPKLVEKIELHAEGSMIRGSAVLTQAQVELVFSQLEPLLTPRRTPRIPVPPAPSASP